MDKCMQCGADLSADEIGLHRKLVNRGATEYLCFDCLARHFSVDKSRFPEMIEKFKADGCSLF